VQGMAVQEITVDELARRLAEGARVIDVREPAEFEHARLAESRLIPLATIPERIEDFRGDGPTYVICRSGGRSMQACMFLMERGVDVVNVSGGMMAWISSARDYVAGPV
jgi:rhodanese-related sulfurtransferase